MMNSPAYANTGHSSESLDVTDIAPIAKTTQYGLAANHADMALSIPLNYARAGHPVKQIPIHLEILEVF